MHPIQRAKERYGLDLVPSDLHRIAKSSLSNGVLMRETVNGQVYMVEYAGQVIMPVIRNDFVVTFFEPGMKASDRWYNVNGTRAARRRRRKRR